MTNTSRKALAKIRKSLTSCRKKLRGLLTSNLPEQNYFSIDQLLIRWRDAGVTFQHLCDWVEHHNFVMGVRVRDTSNLSEQIDQLDGTVLTRTTRSMVLVGPNDTPPPIRTDYLSADTLVKILTASPGVRVGSSVTFATSARNKAEATLHLSGGAYYRAADLVASLDEVHRLEALFKIGRCAPWAARWLGIASSSSSRPATKQAFFVTVAYLIAVGLVAKLFWSKWGDNFQLNLLGDFLAGASAPLTILWLIVQFRQQAKSSADAERDILESARRQEESLRWMRIQAETDVARLELERKARLAETEPALVLTLGTKICHSGREMVQQFELRNEGASARALRVFVKGIPFIDELTPVLEAALLAAGEKRIFTLTVPRDANAARGELTLEYLTANSGPGKLVSPIKLIPAKSDAPDAMPVFELEG